MQATLVLGTVSVVWLAAGLVTIVAPAWLNNKVRQYLSDPFSRFFILQGAALAGVLVVLGTSVDQRSWFWIAIGSLATAKALTLLGLPARHRDRILDWWSARPLWLHRTAGLVAVTLATLLSIEAIRMGG